MRGSYKCFNLVIERLLISGCLVQADQLSGCLVSISFSVPIMQRFHLVIERLLISGMHEQDGECRVLDTFPSRYRAASHFRTDEEELTYMEWIFP